MNIYSVNEAKSRLVHILEEAERTHEPVFIKNKLGKPYGVVLSKEDYESIMETAYLRSIPEMERSLAEADLEKLEDGVPLKDVKW